MAASEPVLLAKGTSWDASFARYLAGRLAMARAETASASRLFAEAAAAFRAMGNQEYVAAARCQQASALAALGDLDGARSGYIECLGIAQEFGLPFWIAWVLAGATELAAHEGSADLAARFFTTARHSIEQSGPRGDDCAPAGLGAESSPPRFGAPPALLAPQDQIVAEAERFLRSPERRGPDDRELTAPLTPRERQVLALLAQGLSDKEIAASLQISRLTAVNHVAAVRRKLRVPSRTAAAALAIQHRLVD